MPNINLIGTEPDQIPTNADLGTMAFQDQDYVNVGNLIVATVDVTTEARFARFSTANATITGGSLSGVTIPLVATLSVTNFSTGNAFISGGSIGVTTAGAVSRVANVYATLGNFTDFSTANALITGGSVTGITGAASTLVVTNFSSANAEITGSASHIGTDTAGAVSRVANVYSSLGNFTNFSTANAQITGTASSWMRGVAIETANLVASGGSIGTTAAGAVSRVANVYSSLGNFTNFSTANAQITGGTINLGAGNITAGNIFITDTSIQNYEYNAVTTKSYVDTMMIIFGT